MEAIRSYNYSRLTPKKHKPTDMNTDYSYCYGQAPFTKCVKCKRYINNYKVNGTVWMIQPCEYEPIKHN